MKEYAANIEYLMPYKGSSIYIKRDDRIPFSYGGNKVRIAAELFKDIERGHYTAVISYGSPSSNMNRAVADMAKLKSIRCVVIVKLEETEAQQLQTENERLVRAGGAELVFCRGGGSDVRACVESVMERLRSEGEKPYYIYGDSTGAGNEASLMRASYLEYAEILDYEHENGVHFDAIVLTAGTGMTIAGLAAARMELSDGTYVLKGKTDDCESADRIKTSSISENRYEMRPAEAAVFCGTRLIGMSAARDEATSRRKIGEAMEAFFASKPVCHDAASAADSLKYREAASAISHHRSVNSKESIQETAGEDTSGSGSIQETAGENTVSTMDTVAADKDKSGIADYIPEICDSYLCGGYGRYSTEIEELIEHMEAAYGLPLDPTYTGKSFYGLIREIDAGRISGNILFIHTGGYPVYLDWKRSRGEA